MPEPSPAKAKISMEMNSVNAALRAAGWLASAAEPMSSLGIGILAMLVNLVSLNFLNI